MWPVSHRVWTNGNVALHKKNVKMLIHVFTQNLKRWSITFPNQIKPQVLNLTMMPYKNLHINEFWTNVIIFLDINLCLQVMAYKLWAIRLLSNLWHLTTLIKYTRLWIHFNTFSPYDVNELKNNIDSFWYHFKFYEKMDSEIWTKIRISWCINFSWTCYILCFISIEIIGIWFI